MLKQLIDRIARAYFIDRIDRQITRLGCDIKTLGEEDSIFICLPTKEDPAAGVGRMYPSGYIGNINLQQTLKNLKAL